MIANKKILAIVPARSGSKGLKDKNILNFCGKPLLAWSIEQALESIYVDTIIVSTDSEKIASIAREFGAITPFIRPNNLSTDKASSIDMILHAIDFMENLNITFDYIVLLEPTSPIRYKKDIDKSIEKLIKRKKASSLVSISKVETTHPVFLMEENSKNFLTRYENSKIKRRQELSELFHVDGTIYISEIAELKIKRTFYHENTIGIKFKKWQTYEIDDEIDFYIIEKLMEKYKEK